MNPSKIHCLFEQSGTFKNEFIKLGYEAEDYDIRNDFGQTDNEIDLFNEITKAYDNEKSIFDQFKKEDLIIAFFPCTRFENKIILSFKGTQYQLINMNTLGKLKNSIRLHEELNHLYSLVSKLVCVCLEKNLRLIIENPYSEQHYLHRYWPIEPSLVDKDRRKRGDYYKKPTQYFFINCVPELNMILEEIPCNSLGISIEDAHLIHNGNARAVNRSLIHEDYAKRFILEFILDGKEETIKVK